MEPDWVYCRATAHLLGQFVLEPQGSGFTTRNDFNLFASTDEWTAPICGEVGPDGAVWMTDWYNFIVQHNPIPHGFEGGRGGAYVTPLRDRTHGRVYRLVYAGAAPSKTYDLSKATPAELVGVLKSDNMLWRMHAQRLMVEKGDKTVIPALIALAGDASVDGIGLNPAVIHALWTLHGLGAFGTSMATALSNRRWPWPSTIFNTRRHRSARPRSMCCRRRPVRWMRFWRASSWRTRTRRSANRRFWRCR